MDHTREGLRIDMAVRATNVGSRAFGTFQLTELRDERGRRFDQAGTSEGLSGLEVADQLGVEFHGREISPGLTAHHAWSFVVAPDVRQLTVVGNRLFPCPEPAEPSVELLPPADPPTIAASLMGQGFTFCRGEPTSFDLEIERTEASTIADRLQIAVVVRATNLGRLPGTTTRIVDVLDEQARRFPQSGPEAGVDISGLARRFGVPDPRGFIAPGATARQVWAFVVPPDVHELTLVERELFSRCQR